MKKSNILILSVIGGAVLLLIGFTAGIRLHIDRNFLSGESSAVKLADVSENTIERSYSVSDFTAVETLGPWSARISRGNEFNVGIKASENIIKYQYAGTRFRSIRRRIEPINQKLQWG